MLSVVILLKNRSILQFPYLGHHIGVLNEEKKYINVANNKMEVVLFLFNGFRVTRNGICNIFRFAHGL